MNPQPLTRTASTTPLMACALVAAITLSATSASAAVLFADNFNRADSTDLNAAATGKSGTLGALSWVEKKSGGEPQISSNTLRLGETGAGAGGFSLAYVDHNFTDAIISTSGEFTVSFDLISPASGGNTRLTGFAVGNSKAELDGWATSTPTSFTSDLFYGYDPTASGLAVGTYIYDGGSQVFAQTTARASGTTFSIRFSGITDFNAGSTVNYEAFINGGSVKTGSFTWFGTNENYIGVYSNYTLDRGAVDNFSISTLDVEVPTPAALPAGIAMLGLVAARRRRTK